MKVGIERAGNKQWEQNETKHTGKKQVKCEASTRPAGEMKWDAGPKTDMNWWRKNSLNTQRLMNTQVYEEKRCRKKTKTGRKRHNEPHMDMIYKIKQEMTN